MIRYGAGEDDWGIEPDQPADDIFRSAGSATAAGGVSTTPPPASSVTLRGQAGATGPIIHFNRTHVTAETAAEPAAAEFAAGSAAAGSAEAGSAAAGSEPEECSICLEALIEGVR